MNEIIIFDGECFICNRFYKWLLRNDKKNHFMFTNIQSKFYNNNSYIDKSKDSIIVIRNNKILYESDAIKYIFKKIETQLLLRFILSICPSVISNFIYRIIAKNRYNFFGKKETCYIPTEEEKKKFII
jgi:predicted DCC family thiol-disulfide oxidoreductase YuxK